MLISYFVIDYNLHRNYHFNHVVLRTHVCFCTIQLATWRLIAPTWGSDSSLPVCRFTRKSSYSTELYLSSAEIHSWLFFPDSLDSSTRVYPNERFIRKPNGSASFTVHEKCLSKFSLQECTLSSYIKKKRSLLPDLLK